MLLSEVHINSLILGFDKFEKLSKVIFPLLKEKGIILNFKGYSNFLKNLENIDELNKENLFMNMRESILWKNYLAELSLIVYTQEQELDNKILYLKAFIDPKRENEELNDMINDLMKNYCIFKNYKIFLNRIIKLLMKIENEILYKLKKTI